MMLAYQPVRSLSTLNMVINQGISAASRILPIIDTVNSIQDKMDAKQLKVEESKQVLKIFFFLNMKLMKKMF